MNKKIIVLLSILMLLVGLSTTCFAKTFSDVKNTKYSEAVDLLSTLSVIDGYPDSTFKPDNIVKRCEMAKLLVIAIGQQSAADTAKGTTKFSDVSSSHWASGFVNIAVEKNLIKGYPDGTFAPEETVTYAEAVTMLVRALGYNDLVEKSGSWPTNYMSKATELKMLDDVEISKNGAGARRGDISILVWNTLKTGTCIVVSEDANGVNYGPGKSLISQKMPNVLCANKGTIVNIDIDKKEITFIDVDGKEIVVTTDKDNIKELLGREINAIYNKKTKKFDKFTITGNTKTIKGDVDKVLGGKVYIGDDEYTLPSSKYIKLVGIPKISEAEEIILTLKNNKVIYAVAIGTEDLYYGLVLNTTTVDNKKAVKLAVFEEDTETLILDNQNAKLNKYDVLVYTINEDDELVIKLNKDVSDSSEVNSVTKYSIKLNNKNIVEYSTKKEFTAMIVDGNEIEEIDMTDINKKTDSAVVSSVNGHGVVIAFADGLDEVEEDEYDGELTKSQVKTRLSSAIKKANALKETKYSISSYANVMKYLEAAEDINTSTASVSKMAKAMENLEEALDDLVLAKDSDKKLREAYGVLQGNITKANKYDSKEYTAESYKSLTTALTAAKKIVLSSTTLTKVNTANTNLEKAIDGLVSSITDEVTKESKDELIALIKEAKALDRDEYTESSYAELLKAISNAEKIDYTSDEVIFKILKAKNELESAMNKLVTNASAELMAVKKLLNDKISEAEKLVMSDYSKKTWDEMKDVLNEIKNTDITDYAANEIEELTDRLSDAIENLEDKDDVTNSLKVMIDFAKLKQEASWDNQDVTWKELQDMILAAEDVLENANTKTVAQIVKAYEDLRDCLI